MATTSNWFWNSGMTPASFAKLNGRERMMASMHAGAGMSRIGVEEHGLDGRRTGMRFGSNDANRALGYTPLPSIMTPQDPRQTITPEPVSTTSPLRVSVALRPPSLQVTETSLAIAPRPTLGIQTMRLPTSEPVVQAEQTSTVTVDRPRFAPGTPVNTVPEFADESQMPVYEGQDERPLVGKAFKSIEQVRAEKAPLLNVAEGAVMQGKSVREMFAGIPTWVKVVGAVGVGALLLQKLAK